MVIPVKPVLEFHLDSSPLFPGQQSGEAGWRRRRSACLFSKSESRCRRFEDGSCDASPHLDLEGLRADKESATGHLLLEEAMARRYSSSGQEIEIKREGAKERERCCRSNARGRRRKRSEALEKMGGRRTASVSVWPCIVAILFSVDMLPLIYNHALLSQKRIKQSMPITNSKRRNFLTT